MNMALLKCRVRQ